MTQKDLPSIAQERTRVCLSRCYSQDEGEAKFEQNTSTSAAAGHAVLTAWNCTKSTVKELDAVLKSFRRNPDGVSKDSDLSHRRLFLSSLGFGVSSSYRRSFAAQFAFRQDDFECSEKRH